jgi:hypothetical protein
MRNNLLYKDLEVPERSFKMRNLSCKDFEGPSAEGF